MINIKEILSIIAIILTFIGYIPYIRDVLKGTTKPHIFSWLVWAITTFIIYALQVSAGAGSGSWITLVVAVIVFSVFILGLKDGDKNIKKVDVIFLILSLSALPIWLIIEQPVLSIILLSAIDILGFAPTVRKSWNKPYSETLSLYLITTFRHGLSILALVEYNIVTWLFPVTWTFANALFAIFLIIRRRKISK